MNQNDIFNLLLIVLLLSNEKENGAASCGTVYGNLNEILLVGLLLGSTGNNSSCDNARIGNPCCGNAISARTAALREETNGNTTF